MKQAVCPGHGWIRGRSSKSKKIMTENRKGKGIGFYPARASACTGENNGFFGKTHSQETKQYLSKMSSMNSKTKGKFWWTNGIISVLDYICPEGWEKGMGEDIRSKMRKPKKSI
jgi:hypothetical protein